MFRISISKCIHQGKELDCYVPEILIGNDWTAILQKGCYILKDSHNPLIICKKCAGYGVHCYMSPTMELIWQSGKPCKECNGIGLRKGVPVDGRHVAEYYVEKAKEEYRLYEALKIKFKNQ